MLREESSKRLEMGAKSRVKPAKMLMLRSLPRTSDRITVLSSAGVDVEEEGGGMAGVRSGELMGYCCLLRAQAVEAREIVRIG